MLSFLKFFNLKCQRFRPEAVRIDASTLCQLDCVDCYIRKYNYCGLGAGVLKFSDFKKFVDMNPFVKSIELSISGEVFLNPELPQILEYAYRKGVSTQIMGGTNFNYVSDEAMEALVKYRVKEIAIAIDGASQEIYVKYRRKGNFDKVIENIKKLNRIKEKYNSHYPDLHWQYVLMTRNECDVPRAIEIAGKLGMKMKFKTSWMPEQTFKDPEKIKQLTGLDYLSRDSEYRNIPKLFSEACLQLWNRPTINWDGRLFGCCANTVKDFGINVFEHGLEKAVRSEKFACARKILTGDLSCIANIKSGGICTNCSKYQAMLKSGNFIKIDRKTGKAYFKE